MGVRHKLRHDENTRLKIKASQIINRLQSYIFGQIQLEPAQVTAALGLLRKIVPDMNAIEHSGEVTQNHIVRLPARPENLAEWQKQHQPRIPMVQ